MSELGRDGIGGLTRALRAALMSNQFLRLVLLGVILGWIATDKLPMTLATTTLGVDGGYYATVATFVRDGRGLLTNVSLHHAGFPYFPHPTSVYPLWPLVWGYVARFFPLVATGLWLSTGFYFLSLVLAYAWATALVPKPLFPTSRFGVLDAGHVLVLMLGLSSQYYKFTSWPYTEALGFVLTFAALLRFHHLAPKPSWAGGVEMGIWLGLCTLCRAQLLLLAMAAIPTLLAAATTVPGWRRRYASMALVTTGVFVLMLVPHYLYIRTFIPDATLATPFRFDQVQATDYLSPVDTLRKAPSWREFLTDRLTGLDLAFDSSSKFAYAHQFYFYPWALLFAAPLLSIAVARWVSRRGVADAWQWLRRRDRVGPACAVVLAFGAFLSTHAMHKAGGGWYFQSRQALPCLFTFFLAMVWLLAKGGVPGKLIGVALLVASTLKGADEVRSITDARLAQSKADEFKQLTRWLLKKKQERGKLTVAFRQPQLFAYQTPGVGYHWYHRGTTTQDVEHMVSDLGVDYVLVLRQATFERSERFQERFEKLGRRSGVRIYVPSTGRPDPMDDVDDEAAPEPAADIEDE